MGTAHQPHMPTIRVRKTPDIRKRRISVVHPSKRANLGSRRRWISAYAVTMSTRTKTIRDDDDVSLLLKFPAPAKRRTARPRAEPAAVVHNYNGGKRTGTLRLQNGNGNLLEGAFCRCRPKG